MPDSSYSIGGVRNEQQTEADRQRARMEQMMFQREMAQRAEAARNNELQAAQAQFNQAEENRRGMLDKDIAARTEATRLQTGGARDIASMQLQAEQARWAGERGDKARETARLESKDIARLKIDPAYRTIVERADLGDSAAKSQLDAINAAYAPTPAGSSFGGYPDAGSGQPVGGMPSGGGFQPQGQAPAQPRSVFAQDHPEVFASGSGSGRGATKATFRSDGGYTLPSASPYSSTGLFTGLSSRSVSGDNGKIVLDRPYSAGYKGPAGQPQGKTDIKRLTNPDQMIAAELQRRVGGSRGGPSAMPTVTPMQTPSLGASGVPDQSSIDEQLAITAARKLAAGMVPSPTERTALESIQMKEGARTARLKTGQEQLGKLKDDLSTDKYGAETMDVVRSPLNAMQDPVIGGALSSIANFFGAKTNAGVIDKAAEREGAKALMPLAQRFRDMQQAVKKRELDPADFENAKQAIADYLDRVRNDSNATIIDRFKKENGL